YAIKHIEKTLSPQQQLLRRLLGGETPDGVARIAGALARVPSWSGVLAWPLRLNDPRGLYAMCLDCRVAERPLGIRP
ncbi:MAG: hypothetical protein D6782_06155, partial [Alphaproteobacteria bacterium]